MATNPHASGGVSKRKKNRFFHGPVAWLLGRQLLASLKGTLLYTAFGSKLDARDWMRAEEYPANNQEEAEREWQRQLNALSESVTTRDFWREQKKAFWFDYIADTGDGMRATYSIAYLCLSDLLLEPLSEARPDAPLLGYSPSVKFIAHPKLKGDRYENADLNRAGEKGKELRLPRGQFLMVGGDTTYHLSDYEGLHKRFQTPFSWAFDDVRGDGRLWKEKGKSWDEVRRPLFGIPGNHDYYDQLDGFRRQFHRPVRRDEEPPRKEPFKAPQLMIPGFVRCQSASYVALRLPFDWLLWALDTEVGKIDERQRKFFREIRVSGDDTIEKGGKPKKLIVATCAPTTVFGKYADKDDEKSSKAFYQLSLPRPFLDKKTLVEGDGPTDLDEGQCRLDLSGDVHLYARYWGTASNENPRGEQNEDRLKKSDCYASVVSGLGGAFHHPSITYAGELSEQVLYPSVAESRREAARNIFSLRNIMRGGGVWAIGFMLAFLLFFAATIGKSSSQAVTNFAPLVYLGISDWDFITPTVPNEANRLTDKNSNVTPLYSEAAAKGSHAFVLSQDTEKNCKGMYLYFWGKCTVVPPREYWLGVALAIASLCLFIYLFWTTERIYKKHRMYEEVLMKEMPPGANKEGESVADEVASRLSAEAPGTTEAEGAGAEKKDQTGEWHKRLMREFFIRTCPGVIGSIIALCVTLFIFSSMRPFLTPYGNSMLVMLTLVWAVMTTLLMLRYSDWLSHMAARITILPEYWIFVWVPSIAAVLGIIFGFALFGQNNTASDLVTDVLLMLVFLLVFAGLTLLGVYKVNEMKKGWRWGLIGGALGLFHALIQFFIPFLMVRKGNWLAWIIGLFLMIAMPFVGRWLMSNNHRNWLLAAWLFFGTLMLLLPHTAFYLSTPASRFEGSSFIKEFRKEEGAPVHLFSCLMEGGAPIRLVSCLKEKPAPKSEAGEKESEARKKPSTWVFLIACFIAGGVGLIMACIWLSWYMAVALLFNGHNNEAGGAARIEKFKQFIRFRLTEDDLTGFVIAVDEPKEHGSQLRPKLIDVIHLKPKQEQKAPAART